MTLCGCGCGKITKICIRCNKPFEVVPARKDSAKFCSKKCRDIYQIGKNNPNWKEKIPKIPKITKITKICLECDKEFQVVIARKDSAKFCSNECRKSYKTKEKIPKITKICIRCGKEFKVCLSSKDSAKYCSSECKCIYLSGENAPMYGRTGENNPMYGRNGENHPRWNPDLTDEDRQYTRQYPEYTEWRNAVLKRNNYTCQVSNKHGNNLVAHHLEGYALNKELRTTLSNGVTLCKTCHNNFHHIYGTHNNTKVQFVEWIKSRKVL